MTRLTVCTYLWTPDKGSRYGGCRGEDVRLLQLQVARHLTVPHDFVVVTDQPDVFAHDRDIRAIPIDWTKHVPGTCFVRLFTFSPQAKDVLGEIVLQLDLDVVITGNIDHIVRRDEPLVLWRNPRKWCLTFPEAGYAAALTYFNCSMMLHRAGTMPEMWSEFDPQAEPPVHLGFWEDQRWICGRVSKDNPHWDGAHGVYRIGPPSRPWWGVHTTLPENSCIVTFPGNYGKPWHPDTMAANPWIAEHRK